MVATYAGTDRDGTTTQGGPSTHVVVDADHVLCVPNGIDPAVAAHERVLASDVRYRFVIDTATLR